ncbi:MAG TPA: aspartate kinase [Saprospiraceae bacterium]|nr:aspartate kinase [Saprospiraceae bacterium]
MKVLKFGGTSVGSPERMRQVADLLENPGRKLVVLSAMAGTTDELVRITHLEATAQVQALNKLQKDYEARAKSLIVSGSLQAELINELKLIFSRLYAYLETESENSDYEILALGELLSTQMFFYLLKSRRLAVKWLDAREILLLNEQERPDEAIIKRRLNAAINNEKVDVFVIQGFISKNWKGRTYNLKRGGSDYSASIFGKALQAEEIQIWTDIDGMHNGDPRFVENTRPIAKLSFDEAAELAYFGAKILHPASIQPAKEANIPVRLKNTLQPQKRGTIISSESDSISKIKSIAAKDNITAIKIKSARMLLAFGFIRRVFQVFEDHSTAIDLITTSEVAVSTTIDDISNLEAIVNDLQELGDVEVDRNLTIICIVGNFIAEDKGQAVDVFTALKNIPLRMISYGGSKHNISILIENQYKKSALQALHESVF